MKTHINRQAADRAWAIWDLDAELRYWPVLNALPEGPVCEIGPGTAGLASWSDRAVVGIEPGGDEWHDGVQAAPNLQRIVSDGKHIPLATHSVNSCIAVDTFEHIWPSERAATVDEMIRVTAPGGRILIIGPTGAAARRGDRWLWDRSQPDPPTWMLWLTEHFERGVPSVSEMRATFLNPRIASVQASGWFNIWLWRGMHAAGGRVGQRTRPLHPIYGTLARRLHRGPYYRWLFIIDLKSSP